MLKKVLVTLVASAFAASVFAQAQPAEPKGQTGAETQKAQSAKPAKKQAKTHKQAQTHKSAPKSKSKGAAKSATPSETKSEAGK